MFIKPKIKRLQNWVILKLTKKL